MYRRRTFPVIVVIAIIWSGKLDIGLVPPSSISTCSARTQSQQVCGTPRASPYRWRMLAAPKVQPFVQADRVGTFSIGGQKIRRVQLHAGSNEVSMKKCGVLLSTPASSDIAAVSAMFQLLVQHQHLRSTMRELQRVGNFSANTTPIKSLGALIVQSQETMTKQEVLLATVIGELSAMGSAWSSVWNALELGPVSRNDIIESLSLDDLHNRLQEAEKLLDLDVERTSAHFEQALQDFSNSYGVTAEEALLREKSSEIDSMRTKLEDLDNEFVDKENEIADMHFSWKKTAEMLNYMADKTAESKKTKAALQALKATKNAIESANARTQGWAILGDLVTLGVGQFTNQQSQKERRAKADYDEFKMDFDTKYGDVDSPAFAEKRIELSAEYSRIKKRIDVLEHEKNNIRSKQFALSEDIKLRHREFRELSDDLKSKLAHVGVANVEHYQALVNSVISFQHQRGKHGVFKMFCRVGIKSIGAYNKFVRQLAKSPHKKQLRYIRGIMQSDAGWAITVPPLGYAQKLSSSLGCLMTHDAESMDSLPKLNDVIMPAAKLVAETSTVTSKQSAGGAASKRVSSPRRVVDVEELDTEQADGISEDVGIAGAESAGSEDKQDDPNGADSSAYDIPLF